MSLFEFISISITSFSLGIGVVLILIGLGVTVGKMKTDELQNKIILLTIGFPVFFIFLYLAYAQVYAVAFGSYLEPLEITWDKVFIFGNDILLPIIAPVVVVFLFFRILGFILGLLFKFIQKKSLRIEAASVVDKVGNFEILMIRIENRGREKLICSGRIESLELDDGTPIDLDLFNPKKTTLLWDEFNNFGVIEPGFSSLLWVVRKEKNGGPFIFALQSPKIDNEIPNGIYKLQVGIYRIENDKPIKLDNVIGKFEISEAIHNPHASNVEREMKWLK